MGILKGIKILTILFSGVAMLIGGLFLLRFLVPLLMGLVGLIFGLMCVWLILKWAVLVIKNMFRDVHGTMAKES